MIGRGSSLDEVRAALDESRVGSPRGVVIAGEAGIGKSRLLEEFLAALPEDEIVLAGQCVDIGSVGAPFASVRTMLRALVAALGVEAVTDAAGYGVRAVATLLPELGVEARPLADSGTDELIDAIAMLVERVAAEHPLLLVLEDVHWADAATLSLLMTLLRALRTGRVLVVLTVRSEDVGEGHALRPVLAEMERSRAVTIIELARLGRAQVAAQMAEILGADPTEAELERVVARSGGVPFLVEELVLLGEGELPSSLRGVLLARYDALEPSTRELVRVLAAGGATVDDEVLAAVHDVPADQLDLDVRAAVAAHMITASGAGYGFRHALVREALLSDLLPRESVRVHTRYAEVLEAGGEASAADVASHWIAARDAPRALAASLAAMEEARNSLAVAAVAEFGEQCLALWGRVPEASAIAGRPRARLLLQVAEASWDSAGIETALARVEEALAELETGGADAAADVHLRTALLLMRSRAMVELAHPEARAQLVELLDLLERESPDDVETRTVVMWRLASRDASEGRPEAGIAMAREAVVMARRGASATTRAMAEGDLGWQLVQLGEIDEGLALIAEASRVDWGDSNDRYRHAMTESDVHLQLGRYDDAIAVAESAIAQATRSGRERMWGSTLEVNLVQACLETGRWERLDRALRHLRSLGVSPGIDVFVGELSAQAAVWRDDFAGAEREIAVRREALDAWARTEVQNRLAQVTYLAWMRLAEADLAGASAVLERVQPADCTTLPALGMPMLALRARVLVDRADEGLVSAGEFDALAAGLRAEFDAMPPWSTTPRWRAVFDAELGGGEPVGDPSGDGAPSGADPRLWRVAVAAADDPSMQVQVLPYALLRLAQAEVSAGDRASAADTCLRAREVAEQRGVLLFARLAGEFARRAGLDPARGGAPGFEPRRGARPAAASAGTAEPLTAREQQVLDLVAEGLSNGQIGERLFISTKTASVHVSAILRKLGVASRTEAAVLAERGRG
ncbi:DNA-binding CsgD family transcriptional regulator/tetratricopeptide (TPR) repeat protein [Agromyces terreus]|uniref:DNA-binding CsgD family transcriptional regulator/tetratricopeptide (TPR) repeat protein n=1 Tax=Agromyces terreus TaxID=424795 RepID=A0A9X2KBZ9_9MICO|nr:helix-turn-helix transcriptional regulator [Agromyces terreus]MCP2370871.1 DNA-binding CsgD family transcriptional regulator/tetratricopeptide (TPR) repeat protein [Agromyces terreus]